MFLDKDTPEHTLVNKYSAEHVRVKHLIRNCEKTGECENTAALEGALERIKDIIQQYIKEKYDEENTANINNAVVNSFCSMV